MIERIIEFSLRHRALVFLAAALLAGAGLWSALHLPMDAVPDITGVQVQINTEVPALAPEEIEKLVTSPIETELSGAPGVTEMRSLSKFGLSQVTLQFADGADIYRARQLVAERLQGIGEKIPKGLSPRLAPVSTGLGEVLLYTIDYAPDAPKPATRPEQLMELRLLQEYTVKPVLKAVQGVAEINTAGGYKRQMIVEPQLAALKDAGLTVEELADVVAKNAENAGGGIIAQGKTQMMVRGVGRVGSAEEIASLPIRFGAGIKPLLVRDAASVAIGSGQRTGAATVNGEEAIVATVMMLSGENSRAVAGRVAAKLLEAQKQLPSGIVLTPLYNRATLVNQTIGTIEKNLFEGAILVVAVLFALLGNWRAALIVSTAIPLAFLFALSGMERFGISGNLMSLGAIDFGLIIDGAVVMVENIVRRMAEKQHKLSRPLTEQERTETVLEASKQVASPMFIGVLIITVVYVPILALTGIEGKMFHPMALTVMLALTGALVLALTWMPALSACALRGIIRERDNLLMRQAKKLYQPILSFALKHRWMVVSGAVALFALAALTFKQLGAEFIPVLDEGSLVVQFNRNPSISLEASIESQESAEKMLLNEFREIQTVFSSLGTPELATDPMGVNQADTWILLKPQSAWRKNHGRPVSKEELMREMREFLERHFPETEMVFSQPIEMRFNELLEGIRADLSVKIYGEDYDLTEKLAATIKEILETLPGAGEIEFETLGRTPLLEIVVNRQALAKYSVQAAEINKVIAGAINGETVGAIIEGNRRFDLVVRLPQGTREKIDQLRQLPVRVGDHGLLPLGALADFRRSESVSPILREAGKRRSALLVNLETSDVEGWVKRAEAKVRSQVDLPEGISIEFGGQFENLQDAKARLAIVVPAALVLIFVLIVMAFGGVRQALLVYSGIPLALTGGVFALWARGMPFSITAAVGFIALSGVAVLNGVVMVSYFNELLKEGKDVLLAMRLGAMARLRPVLMTAAVASLGFVPMALATGAGAEVQRPLATVVIGGIVSSTFLTLVLLPTLYAWIERDRKRPAVETT